MLNRAFPGVARTFHNLLAPGLHSFAGLGRNLHHVRMMSHLVQGGQGGVTVKIHGITETWNTGLEGVAITTAAFQKGLPFPPFIASFSLMLCLVFFAFTTILGWDYYGERCLEYLFNRNKAAVTTYRWLYIICVFIGPYMTVAAVWNIADIFNALMAFPNLIALLALSGVVVKETKDFFKRHKNYEF